MKAVHNPYALAKITYAEDLRRRTLAADNASEYNIENSDPHEALPSLRRAAKL